MPRTQLQRRIATLLGVLVLIGSSLGPAAASAHAAPQGQDTSGQIATGIVVAIDEPTNRSGTAASDVVIRGWAANPASERGTGVSRVDIYLDGGPDQGGFYLGQADYGRERPDVADALGGQRFLLSGWEMETDIPRGPHTIVAVAAPTGNQPALVIPGIASIQAVVGGRAGVTTAECGAGGYCTSMEGGFRSRGPGRRNDPLYAGNLYQATGAFGNGPTTPPYGWWDAMLPDLIPYLIAYQAFAYPNPQQFWGSLPTMYDQALLSTLSTQGALAFPGGGCVGPNFGGLDTLGLSVVGGFSYGFPFFSGIGTTGNGTGTLGLPNSTFGSPFGIGAPLSVPFSGSTGLGSILAGGFTGGYNTSLNTLSRFVGGGTAGPGGIAGSISTSYGGPFMGVPLGARLGGDLFTNTGCNVRL
jgi:hypothetical protein